MTDTIQSTIANRAEKLGLSAYEISKQLNGSPTQETIKRYLTGRCALNSRYVSQLCQLLDLELKPKKVKKMIRKAVLNDRDNVVGFVEVESNVREIEVAGNVSFVKNRVETTDETWDKPDFEPKQFDRTFEKQNTEIVEQLINVNSYRLSSAKKYQDDKFVEADAAIAKCLTVDGDSAYYFV